MNSHNRNVLLPRPPEDGFTLIEVMVGLAIGLLATIIILQVFSVFESQKRTTTGTADAQTNGSIALYDLGREIQLGGFPLMPISSTETPLKCTTLMISGVQDTSTPNRLTPAAILNGAATSGVNASDSVVIRYGDGALGGNPTLVTAGPIGSAVSVANNLGCKVGDMLLVETPGACSMTQVLGLAGSGVINVSPTDAASAVSNAHVMCIGTWHEVTFKVNKGNLERQDSTLPPASAVAAPSLPVVADVVNLQAQYGVAGSAGSNQVTGWVNATGGTWAAPTTDNRNWIKAIRIAVVARNDKKEPKNPATGNCEATAACSSQVGASPTGLCAWEGSASSPAPAIDLSSADPDWACYRYRVFESIYPLRNVIWSKTAITLP